MSLIRFQDVLRDGIQSLLGTNPSAQEIIDAYPSAHLIGTDSIQTAGGTFFDLFAKKGRNEWEEVEKLISHFRQCGVKQSALIRGDFLFGYEPQPYDVIKELVLEYAKLGINILQTFHGMNDPRALVGIIKAVQEAKKDGYNIIAQGTICIEDNPNITVEGCLQFANELIDMGYQGFYLKSASGCLDPKFVYVLASALYDSFPDEDITIHSHSTYGMAPACYIAAAKAAVERGCVITMDVQHPALSGSTSHPSMNKMIGLIKNHPDMKINTNAPKLNIDSIKASMKSLLALRFQYRDYESSYSSKLIDSMHDARAAGGASATLKSVPGLVENLGRLLGKNNELADWDSIQIAIYSMQSKILDDLGQPTQVTPYAANTTGQAAISLWHELEGRDIYHTLYPGIINYLIGLHGKVPESTNKDLVRKAIKLKNLYKIKEYTISTDRPNALPLAKERLIKAGIKNPTIRQMLSLLLTGDQDHVLKCFLKKNKAQDPAEIPFYAQQPISIKKKYIARDGKTPLRDIRDAVKSIGGMSCLQEIAERVLHLKQLKDDHYIFPSGEENLRDIWYESNIQKLIYLLDSISQTLKNDGFSDSQVLSMQRKWSDNNIYSCIRDSVDKKGAGLYDFMIIELNNFKFKINS
jgi:pyruvate/oxaloacetate carboxyltransferase